VKWTFKAPGEAGDIAQYTGDRSPSGVSEVCMKKKYATPVVTASDVVRDTELGFISTTVPETQTLYYQTIS
jgi:hypothetical protein